MRDKKGFTLVEVLIVVIIIAVLAALILPRFFAQTENAYVNEAQQMLGALRRSQVRTQDMTGGGPSVGITACPVAAACVATQWQAIGMAVPGTNLNGAWDYACAAGGTSCTATRVNSPSGGERNGNVIELAFNGTWNCNAAAGGSVPYVAANPVSQGCKA